MRIRLFNTHEELKNNWNSYKQKQANIKYKSRLKLYNFKIPNTIHKYSNLLKEILIHYIIRY